MQLAIDWPSPATSAPQLCLLLPAAGAADDAMLPLAEALRAAFREAAIAAPSELFSATVDRSRAAWAHRWVRLMQQRAGATPQATLLAGVGSGADLALALVIGHDGLAGRVLSFGGGWAEPPTAAPLATTLHLLHGGADPRLPAGQVRGMLGHLGVLHADATLDLAEAVADPLHPALIDCALHRLRNHIPLRTWQAALGAARQAPGAAN